MNLSFSNENMIYLLIGFIITTIILILFFIKQKSGLNILSFFKNDNEEIKDDYVMIEKEKETKECVPQMVVGGLSQKSNVYLVNVLSDKMNYVLSLNGEKAMNSLSKSQFEELMTVLSENDSKEDAIFIFYCACYSCNAAKNYTKEALTKFPVLNNDNFKLYDYTGGFHEWCAYSLLNDELYTLHHIETGEKLSTKEVKEVFDSTNHSYFVENTVKKNESEDIIKIYLNSKKESNDE